MPIDAAPGIKVFTLEEMDLPPYDGATTEVKSEFIGHHTTGSNLGDPDPIEWWKNIYDFHVNTNGWVHIGYNFGIARGDDGPDSAKVLMARGYNGVGAHTIGHNTAGLGIAYLGDGGEAIEPGIFRAYRLLWDTASDGVFRGRLTPAVHSDFAETACPGDKLREWFRGGLLIPSVVSAPIELPAPVMPVPDMPPAPPFPLDLYPAPSYIYFDDNEPEYVAGPGVAQWQARMAERGWVIDVDSLYGPASEDVCLTFQTEKGLAVDGIVGPNTWRAGWEAPIT